MTFEELLLQLGPKLGIEALKVNEQGQCPLAFNNKYQLFLEKGTEDGACYVYGALCPIPQHGRLELYDLLMGSQLMGVATGGGSFASSPQLGRVLMYRVFDLNESSFEAFLKAFEKFLNAYARWVDSLEKSFKANPPTDQPSGITQV
ncbi:MAG TPA: type III secretion system chaperone [Opitutales bacterium]|nr:type III secretion system chaperone [Opitutales bacterium]